MVTWVLSDVGIAVDCACIPSSLLTERRTLPRQDMSSAAAASSSDAWTCSVCSVCVDKQHRLQNIITMKYIQSGFVVTPYILSFRSLYC